MGTITALHGADPDIASQLWNGFEKQITCEKQTPVPTTFLSVKNTFSAVFT